MNFVVWPFSARARQLKSEHPMGKFAKTHIFAIFCTFWTIFIHFEASSDFSNTIISIQGTVRCWVYWIDSLCILIIVYRKYPFDLMIYFQKSAKGVSRFFFFFALKNISHWIYFTFRQLPKWFHDNNCYFVLSEVISRKTSKVLVQTGYLLFL